jgi:hypothetical protein
LCAQVLLSAEADEPDQCDEEKAFHYLRCLTFKSQTHIPPPSFDYALLWGDTGFETNDLPRWERARVPETLCRGYGALHSAA